MQKGSGYKAYHEGMTSNNTGTTALESTMVVVPTLLSLHILAGLQSHRWVPSAFGSHKIAAFFAEFFCVIMPSILSLTIWADYAIYLVILIAILGPLLAVRRHISGSNRRFFSVYSRIFEENMFKTLCLYKLSPKPRTYISNFRAITNMLSVLCIFAVDFHIFPRRFAKTETFGFGVMDLGVGLYIVANSLVAPETYSTVFAVPISKAFLHSLPLVILGFGRLIMTRQVEYQEHITEYGVHWNFFFTLAFTNVVCSVILKYVNRSTYGYFFMFLGLTITYEITLQIGLQDWILSDAPRHDFVSANREGIASIMGYVALYFGGITLGRQLRSCDKYNVSGNFDMMKMLLVFTTLLWSVTATCHSTFGVSRRLANMGYIFWILAFTTTVIALLLLVEFSVIMIKVVGVKQPDENVLFVPKLLEAINRNGLLFFLLGNVLTGMFNIHVQTFTLNSATSFIVLNIYMIMNCAAVAILQAWDISLKV